MDIGGQGLAFDPNNIINSFTNEDIFVNGNIQPADDEFDELLQQIGCTDLLNFDNHDIFGSLNTNVVNESLSTTSSPTKMFTDNQLFENSFDLINDVSLADTKPFIS